MGEEETIRIEYDYSTIESKTPDEKLNLLLRIAFANHHALQRHGKILYGNGEAGLCDTTRENKKAIKYLYSLFVLACGGFAGVLFTHLSK
jgi:hypothetical protein